MAGSYYLRVIAILIKLLLFVIFILKNWRKMRRKAVLSKTEVPISNHSHEWQRLKNQGTTTQTSQEPSEKDKYLKSLMEMSQNWIKGWPDTTQGCMMQMEKLKETKRSRELALIQIFKNKQGIAKENNSIEYAKQIIFERSCYGKQLLSALLESKTLEERDIQVEFQKKLTEKAKASEQNQKSIGCSLLTAIDMENKEKAKVKRNREVTKETAECNKAMYLTFNEMKKEELERQRRDEIDDLKMMKKIIEKENAEEVKLNDQLLRKQDLEQCIADRKKVEERRQKREIEEERRAKQWHDYDQKRNCKIAMMHRERFQEKPQVARHYDLIDKLQNEEKRLYDEFVNKGILEMRDRQTAQEEKDKLKKDNELNNNTSILELNNKLVENKLTERYQNRCTCDRQSIPGMSKPKVSRKKAIRYDISKYSSAKMHKNAKMRETEKTPWSGLPAAHTHFAQQANETLQQCKYKNMARKVVDDYRRLNGLTPQTLPIPNYF